MKTNSSSIRNPQSAIRNLRAGFSLLELILVLTLIVIAAAVVAPSLSGAFAYYHIERAAEDLQARISNVRLLAMEQGVPYAFTYEPGGDRFWTWACEPLATDSTGLSMARPYGPAGAAAVAAGDAYDRRYYALNHREDNREFQFLASSTGEVISSMGLSADARANLPNTVSGEAIAASSLLSPTKLGLASPSARSLAALQIPGLQLSTAADPLVFEPDGAADKDAIIRIADRDHRYAEITVHAMTGAITSSSARLISDLTGTQAVPSHSSSANQPSRTGLRLPSRSREFQQSPGGLP